jgi:short-subunit dehydrogenase
VSLPEPASDTTVLVTGSSSGIGEAIAHELSARGYHLSLAARRRERLEELASSLEDEHGVKVTIHAVDLARDAERNRLLRELRSGRALVGLCNNAGTGAFGRFVEHDAEEEDQVFRTNALALFDLTNRLARGMVERGEGAILNTASILAFAPIPQNATYAATKAFIQSFSEALHTELQGTGVSCTTVNPGPTRTSIFDRSGAPGAAGFGDQIGLGGLFWQDAEDVARDAVAAMVEGRRTVTPGLTNKLAALGLRSAPRTAFLPISRAAQSGPVRRLLLGDDADESRAE